MKLFVSLVGLVCVVGLVANGSHNSNRLDGLQWRLFKSKFNKVYASQEEDNMRRSIFLASKQKIERHNAELAPKLGFTQGLSHLSDRTDEELNGMNGLRVGQVESNSKRFKLEESPEFLRRMLEVDVAELPKEVDWRKSPGRVSEVKDQGQCGSCWAFATTGVLEGQEVKLNLTGSGGGQLVSLSEENLVDCARTNLACGGGIMEAALNDIAKEHGIEAEKDYPYVSGDGRPWNPCTYDKSKSVLSVKGAQVLDGTEEAMQKVVAQFGPVATGIAATGNLVYYDGGVLDDNTCDKTQLNHAILVVGYGTDPDFGDYWLVKNSWGADWGESGYFRTARNKDNSCGIASIATIPVF